MPNTPREALRLMDERRKTWWIVRQDNWAPGIWQARIDPSMDYDWTYRVGYSRWRAEGRVTTARKTSRTGENLRQIRRIADSLRHSSGSSAGQDGA